MVKTLDDITFNVIDWADRDDEDIEEDDEQESGYVIEAYGKTQDKKSVYLKINGFTPYFFVEIPKTWKDTHVKRFIDFIRNKTYGKFQNSLITYDVVKKHRLYGFTAGKRFKFVRLVFNTNEGMKKYKWIFNSKHKIPGLDNTFKEYKAYESGFPPLLRFMHIQNINASGWLKINKKKYTKIPKRGFNTDIAIEAKWTDVEGYENSKVADISILSYEIGRAHV